MLIKLADTEIGRVYADGTIAKSLTEIDKKRLDKARIEATEIMEASGVRGPFVDGMIHGGHLGGTVSLAEEDVTTMHPSWLPQNLWVADLSLMPRSQGLPTILTSAALALRVAKHITEEKKPKRN
jgi:choline dehydrogenase-like flavoprotein